MFRQAAFDRYTFPPNLLLCVTVLKVTILIFVETNNPYSWHENEVHNTRHFSIVQKFVKLNKKELSELIYFFNVTALSTMINQCWIYIWKRCNLLKQVWKHLERIVFPSFSFPPLSKLLIMKNVNDMNKGNDRPQYSK